ncbi:MAG: hypothetical protein NY202_02935 [Mollicutes bacterium UO1]
MTKKIVQHHKYTETSLRTIDESGFKYGEKINKILSSDKTPHEKKMALFNFIKNLDVGELQPQENQRVNSLLLGKVYAELAKESMKEYKKTTSDIFNKEVKN